MRNLPDRTVPPPATETLDEPISDSRIFAPTGDAVALLVDDEALRSDIEAALRDAGYRCCGPRELRVAHAVICEVRDDDVTSRIASIRTQSRPDVALLAIPTRVASTEVIASAHAAGVFACLRQPIVTAELLGLLTSAFQTRTARVQVADLSKRLDLETHLASIGRLSTGLAHELATPLTVVQAAFDVVDSFVAGDGTRETSMEALRDARSALARVRALLRTLQELAREHHATLQSVDLGALARDVHAWAAGRFPCVAFELAVAEPLSGRTSTALLHQILVNLMSNAAQAASRFASPRVRLHVYRDGRSAVLSVRDNGPGIAPEEQEKIFEPFYTTRRESGGTGLGLALCREYALQIGADLALWSAPARGACFRLRVPLA